MIRKSVSIVLGTVFLICLLTSCAQSNKVNNTAQDTTSFDDIVGKEITAEKFYDSYYFSMLYPPLNGNWSQSDITYLLTKYIESDIEKNKSDSPFDSLRNSKIIFFYTVDTGTEHNSISFLIKKSGELNNLSNIEFMTLQMFVTYKGEEFDDLDSYDTKVYVGNDVVFNNSKDFLAYLNSNMHNASVFFERGWIEVK